MGETNFINRFKQPRTETRMHLERTIHNFGGEPFDIGGNRKKFLSRVFVSLWFKVFHCLNRFLAAAAMARAVGRCAVHKFG